MSNELERGLVAMGWSTKQASNLRRAAQIIAGLARKSGKPTVGTVPQMTKTLQQVSQANPVGSAATRTGPGTWAKNIKPGSPEARSLRAPDAAIPNRAHPGTPVVAPKPDPTYKPKFPPTMLQMVMRNLGLGASSAAAGGAGIAAGYGLPGLERLVANPYEGMPAVRGQLEHSAPVRPVASPTLRSRVENAWQSADREGARIPIVPDPPLRRALQAVPPVAPMAASPIPKASLVRAPQTGDVGFDLDPQPASRPSTQFGAALPLDNTVPDNRPSAASAVRRGDY